MKNNPIKALVQRDVLRKEQISIWMRLRCDEGFLQESGTENTYAGTPYFPPVCTTQKIIQCIPFKVCNQKRASCALEWQISSYVWTVI